MATDLGANLSDEGRLELITGPMFSGKTTELIRRLRVSLVVGKRCCVVRPSIDDRWLSEGDEKPPLHTHYSNAAGTASGGLAANEAFTIVSKTLASCKDELTSYDLVAVDEGQFFPDLAEVCPLLAQEGVHVVVSALNGTYAQTPFEPVSQLYPHCDKIIMLRAVCMSCRAREAAFTARARDVEARARAPSPKDGTFVDVGGEEKYRAVCRACLHR